MPNFPPLYLHPLPPSSTPPAAFCKLLLNSFSTHVKSTKNFSWSSPSHVVKGFKHDPHPSHVHGIHVDSCLHYNKMCSYLRVFSPDFEWIHWSH
jgi:hypothetical protein